jgi:hypothetical protein
MRLQSRIAAASAVLLLVPVAAVSFAQGGPQGGGHPADERQFATHLSDGPQAERHPPGGAGNSAHLLAANAAEMPSPAQTSPGTANPPSPVAPVANPCPRYPAGSVVQPPPELVAGKSNVILKGFTWIDHRSDHVILMAGRGDIGAVVVNV